MVSSIKFTSVTSPCTRAFKLGFSALLATFWTTLWPVLGYIVHNENRKPSCR